MFRYTKVNHNKYKQDIKSLQYDLNYSKSNKNVSNLTTFVFFVGNY